MPDKALLPMAANKIKPPIKVFALGASPRNRKTQSGPSKTSARDNRASSPAGRLRDPRVYNIRPAPTWKTPIPREIKLSFLFIIKGSW